MHSDSRSFVRAADCRTLAVRAPRLASTSFTRRFSSMTQYSIAPADSPLTRRLSIYLVSFADRWEREMSGPQQCTTIDMRTARRSKGVRTANVQRASRARMLVRRIRGTPTEAVATDFVTRSWDVDIASNRSILGIYGFLPPREPLLCLYGWLYALSALYGWL